MATRLAAALPRFLVLVLVLLPASATLTYAAQRKIASEPRVVPSRAPVLQILVVPNVRGQAYVFAKGTLEDNGFAWRVQGTVDGYAANTVAEQSPAPGVRVIDTGSPTIVLRLQRNSSYAEQGTPENSAPFTGSEIRLAESPERAAPAPAPAAAPRRAKPARRAAKAKPTSARHARPPAFAAPGARREPLTEMSLPARARRLGVWLSAHRRPTDANVRAYLYQHAWIVEGAKFGWWHGRQALRILIRVDDRQQRLWRTGAVNERVARRALAYVQARQR
jgi:PASTA domain